MYPIIFHIRKDEEIREVQERFSAFFPYLRLNFFRTKAGNGKIGGEAVVFCPEVKLSEVNPSFPGAELEISDATTIDEFENRMYKDLGLPVQVLRKSGNLWLGTSMSNHWTLKEQNEHGEAISPDPQRPPSFMQVPYGC